MSIHGKAVFRGNTVFTAALLLLMVSCATWAGSATQDVNANASLGKLDFDQLDQDHDGYLRRSEVADELIKVRFSTFDLDHDLRLDRREFKAARHMDNVAHDRRVPDAEYGRFANNPASQAHTAPGGGAPL